MKIVSLVSILSVSEPVTMLMFVTTKSHTSFWLHEVTAMETTFHYIIVMEKNWLVLMDGQTPRAIGIVCKMIVDSISTWKL